MKHFKRHSVPGSALRIFIVLGLVAGPVVHAHTPSFEYALYQETVREGAVSKEACPRSLLKEMRRTAKTLRKDLGALGMAMTRGQDIFQKVKSFVGASFAPAPDGMSSSGSRQISAPYGKMALADKGFLSGRLEHLPLGREQGLVIGESGVEAVDLLLRKKIAHEAGEDSLNRNLLAAALGATSLVGAMAGVITLGMAGAAHVWPDAEAFQELGKNIYGGNLPADFSASALLAKFGGGILGVDAVLGLVSYFLYEGDPLFEKFLTDVEIQVLNADPVPGLWSYSFNYRGAEGDIVVYCEAVDGEVTPHLLLILRERTR